MAALEDFVKTVRVYLDLIEQSSTLTGMQVLSRSAVLLPRLYSLGQLLPDVEPGESEPKRGPFERRLSLAIEQREMYWLIHDPIYDPVDDREPVAGLLSEDLLDIYDALKGPLDLYETGDEDAVRTAIWHWRFELQGHCGDHLVNSLPAIHRLVHDHLGKDLSGFEHES